MNGRALGTHRAWLREEVVDVGDAPHALQVLLGLDGDRAHRPRQLTPAHRHLDAGLWARRQRRDGRGRGIGRGGGGLRPGQPPLPLPGGQGGAGVGLGLGFGGWFSIASGRGDGDPGGLSQEAAGGQRSGHVCAVGELNRALDGLQRLLFQLVEGRGAYLAAAFPCVTAPGGLDLL